jgi:DNA polymerase-3 subunit delta
MTATSAKPVYVLAGQDAYLRRQSRRALMVDLLGPEPSDLAVVDVDSTAELSAVLDELRTAPFLAERRLVFVEGADKFITQHAEALTRYLGAPASTGALVLIANAWPPSSGRAKGKGKDEDVEEEKPSASLQTIKALIAAVTAKGAVIDCSPPAAGTLPAWIVQQAQRLGKTIDPKAASQLAQCVGPDMARLENELEKLALYAGQRPAITDKDVAKVVVGSTREVSFFDLPNALQRGDVKNALAILDSSMGTRGNEFLVLGQIRWHLRKMASSPPNPRRGRKSDSDLRATLDADLAIKSGADALTTMQMLVMKLCR